MVNTIRQLQDLKEWAQDSTRYERRLAFRGGQLVQPGPGRQGFKGEGSGKSHWIYEPGSKNKKLKKEVVEDITKMIADS